MGTAYLFKCGITLRQLGWGVDGVESIPAAAMMGTLWVEPPSGGPEGGVYAAETVPAALAAGCHEWRTMPN